MTAQIEKIELLKLKLTSITKRNFNKGKEVLRLKQIEKVLTDELSIIRTSMEFTTRQLQELQKLISAVRHQISLVDICSSSEKSKMETHIAYLKGHSKGFETYFYEAKYRSELLKKEIKQNEDEKQQLKKQEEMQRAEMVEQLLKDSKSIENECVEIERECVVLKKRNNAIMLKLRRKLVDSENKRKELMKKKDIPPPPTGYE